MLRIAQLVVVAGLSLSLASGQPVSCIEDAHCSQHFYCDIDTHVCQDCLRCEDLKREPPSSFAPDVCIKSVLDCGPCLKGLELNRHTDVNLECVPPDPTPTPEGSTSYLWAIICGTLLFIGLVIAIIVYLLHNPEIFKPTGPSPSITACITASAPEAPPPYNPSPHYSAVRPESPGGYPYPANGNGHAHNGHAAPAYGEDERPFIKRPPPPRPANARELDANQSARAYNPPTYTQDYSPSEEHGIVSDVNEETSFSVQDQDTTPSGWEPGGHEGDGDDTASNAAGGAEASSGGTNLSAMLAAARETDLVDPSPAKKLRKDSSAYSGREGGSGDGAHSSFPRSPSPGRSPPYFITQITNVLQFNNNK